MVFSLVLVPDIFADTWEQFQIDLIDLILKINRSLFISSQKTEEKFEQHIGIIARKYLHNNWLKIS